jgi:hypothetical protein
VHTVVAALAVAMFGVLAMLIVDHGPWNRPNVRTAEVANHRTTGEAARAAAQWWRRPSQGRRWNPNHPGRSLCSPPVLMHLSGRD